jgi:DNA-binding FadR family transcriptional regulator
MPLVFPFVAVRSVQSIRTSGANILKLFFEPATRQPFLIHFSHLDQLYIVFGPVLVYFSLNLGDEIMTDPDTRKPGASDIAARLKQEIDKGNLGHNDRLAPERRLADSYGVARGTIRAALNLLAEKNLVEIRPGSGTYVTYQADEAPPPPLENANPLELMDVRFAIEPHTCRLAVLHGRRANFDRLEELCHQMENSGTDAARFSTADTEFHRTLAKCTRNGLLVWIIDQITKVRDQEEWMRMRQLTLNGDIIARYNLQHRQILEALRARDAEKSAELMKEHLETARLSLTRAAAT